MAPPSVAFVMEQTLGSVTHYLNLRREEGAAENLAIQWVPVDYRPGRLPWAVSGSLLARRALAEVAGTIDGLFVHTTTIALLCGSQMGRTPCVLSTDGTPLNKRGMREWYGLRSEGRLAERVKTALYRKVFRRAQGFVAWSRSAKESLVADYGCRSEDVEVIPPGIDLSEFAPGNRQHDLPRILFVGGDFERKGGDLLLEVFRRKLRGRAELELVTKGQVADEPGVRVHRNVGANSPELRKLYAECDIFALPTRADCYPLVCMEAMAAGLPMVATRVGGIPDLILEGETGHAIDSGDAGALLSRLEPLVADAALRSAMGRRSRAEAERRFEVRSNSRRLFAYVASRCG